jgi:hypothetical protein
MSIVYDSELETAEEKKEKKRLRNLLFFLNMTPQEHYDMSVEEHNDLYVSTMTDAEKDRDRFYYGWLSAAVHAICIALVGMLYCLQCVLLPLAWLTKNGKVHAMCISLAFIFFLLTDGTFTLDSLVYVAAQFSTPMVIFRTVESVFLLMFCVSILGCIAQLIYLHVTRHLFEALSIFLFDRERSYQYDKTIVEAIDKSRKEDWDEEDYHHSPDVDDIKHWYYMKHGHPQTRDDKEVMDWAVAYMLKSNRHDHGLPPLDEETLQRVVKGEKVRAAKVSSKAKKPSVVRGLFAKVGNA